MTYSNIRQCNMELLRIIAMTLVVCVHLNFYALGTPRNIDFEMSLTGSFTRVFINTLSIVCVTIFILISGWFSIKPSFKGLGKLIFQILYFSIGIYVFFIVFKDEPISVENIRNCLYLSNWDWFVKSYIALYILAPVLNSYVEKSTSKQLASFLIAFYVFQTIFTFRGAANFIQSGYSAFSFIGLYLLGRYLKLYYKNKYNASTYAILIILLTFINSVVYSFDAWTDRWMLSGICLSYANPLNILIACLYLLLFSKITVPNSKFILTLSTSSFAVYLFHYDPHILVDYFCSTSVYIFNSYNGVEMFLIYILLIFCIFAASTILDQPRIKIWELIDKRFFNKTSPTGLQLIKDDISYR